MKALLVTERQSLKETVDHHIGPQGVAVIHYENPLKAMDNIVEIDPEIVLFSARDYPRHWKPFLIFLRNHRERRSTIFILLTPPKFDSDEAAKAQHLGVNGIVEDSLHDSAQRDKLKAIVQRYKKIEDHRTNQRYAPDEGDRMIFVFSHPFNYSLVTGTVRDISGDGLRFEPFNTDQLRGLEAGTLIDHAGLRIGDETLHPPCKVVSAGADLRLSFHSMDPEERGLLLSHLASRVLALKYT
ncbi:MAG: PilZ domain-containing protein [Spirochaetaceae bacterium]|nr:MAG: PilZ domain-containing protein [Spirochaetaceae bacterium]